MSPAFRMICAAFSALAATIAVPLAAAFVLGSIVGLIWLAAGAYRSVIDPIDAWIASDTEAAGAAGLVLLATLSFFGFLLVIGRRTPEAERNGPDRREHYRLHKPFPPLDRDLVKGTSPVFAVIVRGENLLTSFGKPRERFFLEQHVVVNAPTYLSACKRAVDLVKCDQRLSAHLQNRADDQPRYYIGAVKQVSLIAGKNRIGPPIWTSGADYALG